MSHAAPDKTAVCVGPIFKENHCTSSIFYSGHRNML